jgi:transcriptional regulator with XRE-family HTH domain
VEQAAQSPAVAFGQRLREVRERKAWYQQDLADRLTMAGYPMNRVTVAKVEAGKRGVTADDLLAFAAVLNVSPNRLLLPDLAGDEPVSVTPAISAPAWAVWSWAEGQGPLPTLSEDEGLNTQEETEEYLLERPAPLRRREQHPAVRAATHLVQRVQRVVYHATKKPQPRKRDDLGFDTTLKAARLALHRVTEELDRLELEESEKREKRS